MPAKSHRHSLHSPARVREYARHSPTQTLLTTCQRDTSPFSFCASSLSRFPRDRKVIFFRLIEFLNVVLSGWFQLQLSVRVYETEDSSHGRQGTLSADGLFFSFWFW